MCSSDLGKVRDHLLVGELVAFGALDDAVEDDTVKEADASVEGPSSEDAVNADMVDIVAVTEAPMMSLAAPEEATEEATEEVPVQFHKSVTFSQVESMNYEQKKALADRCHGFTEAGGDLEDDADEACTGAVDIAQRVLWAAGVDMDLNEGSEGSESDADEDTKAKLL